MTRFSQLLKIGTAIALTIALSATGIALAHTVFSIDLGSVTIREPLQISISPSTPVNQKVPTDPGDGYKATVRVTNLADTDYQVVVYPELWLADETKPGPNLIVRIRNGEREYHWGEPIPINGLMTYEFKVEIYVPKDSPPGSFKILKVHVDRVWIEPSSPTPPPPPSSCTSSGGCG